MYIHVTSLQYIDGKWAYTDTLAKTINTLVNESRYNLITVTDSLGKLYLLDNNILDVVLDKTQSLGQYLINNSPTIPELSEPVELINSNYEDITDTTVMGLDYVLGDTGVPFVISAEGIRRVDIKLVKSIHPKLATLGEFTLGKLVVDLPWTRHTFMPMDFVSSSFRLRKKFKLNNTLLVFGDSLIKANRIFKDDGDGYSLRTGYEKWLVDLYMENITKIPPSSIGQSDHRMYKATIVELSTLIRLFTHQNVFFVEYDYEYPLGDEVITTQDENIDMYYSGLVMFNNKPTTGKVVHRNHEFMLRKVVTTKNLETFNDNPTIQLSAADVVTVVGDGYIYNLDYPKVQRKI